VKRKLIWSLILLTLFVCLYVVVFRTQSVTYQGEDENWCVKINAELVGLNGSYHIKIKYKGKESISDMDYNIYPHYGGGFPSQDEDGFYHVECNDQCGFYDKDKELLFSITWIEEKSLEEKVKWFKLKKEIISRPFKTVL
jgi:hypothetical protein